MQPTNTVGDVIAHRVRFCVRRGSDFGVSERMGFSAVRIAAVTGDHARRRVPDIGRFCHCSFMGQGPSPARNHSLPRRQGRGLGLISALTQ